MDRQKAQSKICVPIPLRLNHHKLELFRNIKPNGGLTTIWFLFIYCAYIAIGYHVFWT